MEDDPFSDPLNPVTVVEKADRQSSARFLPCQNYPNPTNPITTIEYALPKAGDVRIAIYDMLGRRVRTIVDKSHSAGRYQTSWDGLDKVEVQVAAGVYFYKMEVGDFVRVKKLALVR